MQTRQFPHTRRKGIMREGGLWCGGAVIMVVMVAAMAMVMMVATLALFCVL